MNEMKNKTPEFKEFGGTAFVIDGVASDQFCREVEIQQIIDDVAIVKCQPDGRIMIQNVTELFHSSHDCNEAIRLNLIAKQTAKQKAYEELIRFMLKYDISPNLPTKDRLARWMAIKKARELGVDVEDIAE